MDIRCSNHLSTELKDIFWDIFFKAKDRGISLNRHFPWIEKNSDDCIFFEAHQDDAPIGGLVLRKRTLIIDHTKVNLGIIGLVCVTAENRGVGVAAKLIDHTIAYAKQYDFDLLTLWTNQHRVYSRHHFFVNDPWYYGWVLPNRPLAIEADTIEDTYIHQSTLLKQNSTLPLPPFASALYECIFDTGSFTVAEDKQGLIIVGYTGNYIDVLQMMIKALPAQWRLNATKDDPLLQALIEQGLQVNLSPSNLQMWLNMKENETSNAMINQINIPVLDRI